MRSHPRSPSCSSVLPKVLASSHLSVSSERAIFFFSSSAPSWASALTARPHHLYSNYRETEETTRREPGNASSTEGHAPLNWRQHLAQHFLESATNLFLPRISHTSDRDCRQPLRGNH
ncbi:hypothetical protein BT67DRAFT_42178 [Trichocladium antarcticum]|uniref:Uncharacterized protein n=1 Tax=Trichocladium antarcticum TaxID=1450529 RepID=A0AAN6ZDS0_9PEZI|nr:hypothetical protein BT67DRAFT_42178 [Trichocladium antarcticum]